MLLGESSHWHLGIFCKLKLVKFKVVFIVISEIAPISQFY